MNKRSYRRNHSKRNNAKRRNHSKRGITMHPFDLRVTLSVCIGF